jgi:lipid-binding SYLF domain-containing protein
MKTKTALAASGLIFLGLAASAGALAASRGTIDKRVAETLTEFHGLNSANKDLVGKSAGMLVFPKVTKGGVGVAGEYGEGALVVNGKTMGYYSVGAASVGLTLGVAEHSEIIMFMTADSLNAFKAAKGWSIGADAGITVVSAAASGAYDSKIEQKPILGFMFGEKGLLADLSLEGEKITPIKKGSGR